MFTILITILILHADLYFDERKVKSSKGKEGMPFNYTVVMYDT